MVALHRLLMLAAGASLIAGILVRVLPVPGFGIKPSSFLLFTTSCATLGIALMVLEIYNKICQRETPPAGQPESEPGPEA